MLQIGNKLEDCVENWNKKSETRVASDYLCCQKPKTCSALPRSPTASAASSSALAKRGTFRAQSD
jgi:hypothetical protein